MVKGREQPKQFVRDGLQVSPLRTRDEFETADEYWDYIDEVNRFNNGIPSKRRERERPPRTTAQAGQYQQLGLKLALPDYEQLARLAEKRRLTPTTFARTLLVRALAAEWDGG